MLNPNKVALSLGLIGAIIHLACNVWNWIFNIDSPIVAEMYELMHPFTTWPSVSGVIIGLVEVFIYGLVIGYIFSWIYNALNKKA